MTTYAKLSHFIKTYSTGVIAATISTWFAGYMLINGQVSEEKIDVVIRHQPVVSPLKGRLRTGSVPKQWQPDEVTALPSDQIQTGSIPKSADNSPGRGKKQNMRQVNEAPLITGPNSYVVRIATKELALVEGGGKLWSVKPGRLLPGSGRVLHIKRRNKKWVVVTTHGEIK